MKINGFKKVEINCEATLRQPYPVVESIIMVDGIQADLVVCLKEGSYTIDGVDYSGELLLCLGRSKP